MIFAWIKSFFGALGQKTCIEWRKGDHCTHLVPRSYWLEHSITLYFSEQVRLFYMSPIGSPLCTPSISSKCLDVKVVKVYP